MSDAPPGALPAGGKDVLAVEAQELRAVEAALRDRFTRYGYREVMTPPGWSPSRSTPPPPSPMSPSAPG